MTFRLRRFAPTDGHATHACFYRAVHITAATDYDAAQLSAWAPDDFDLDLWVEARSAQSTVVADTGDSIVGFGGLEHGGCIDMLYVDPAHGCRGVGTAILRWLTNHAARSGTQRLTANVSATARGFFEAHGFVVTERRDFLRRGVLIFNYAMTKSLTTEDERISGGSGKR